MKVIVYVEGPSDQLSLEELLRPLLKKANNAGVAVTFIPIHPKEGKGNSKRELITKTPRKAVNILCNDEDAIVITMPDLYPKDTGGPHQTYEELKELVQNNFTEILKQKNISDKRINQRFRVFCFKYDLEALVLAAEEQLAARLRVSSIYCTWVKPVENQDHNKPPKQIVEEIFKEHNDHYKGTIDAPLILGDSNYNTIAQRCPQCFKPFVEYLESLLLI
jgi:hypothetical protein